MLSCCCRVDFVLLMSCVILYMCCMLILDSCVCVCVEIGVFEERVHENRKKNTRNDNNNKE